MAAHSAQFSIARLAVILALLNLLQGAVIWQAEDGVGFEPSQIRARSQAAGLTSVWLETGEDYVMWTFCLTSADNVTVQEVRYSMDANKKKIAVVLDRIKVGTFLAAESSSYGHNWDVFLVTSQPFSTVQLQPGPHILRVRIDDTLGDVWGVEVDQVTLTFQSGATSLGVSCANSNSGSARTRFTSTRPRMTTD